MVLFLSPQSSHFWLHFSLNFPSNTEPKRKNDSSHPVFPYLKGEDFGVLLVSVMFALCRYPLFISGSWFSSWFSVEKLHFPRNLFMLSQLAKLFPCGDAKKKKKTRSSTHDVWYSPLFGILQVFLINIYDTGFISFIFI